MMSDFKMVPSLEKRKYIIESTDRKIGYILVPRFGPINYCLILDQFLLGSPVWPILTMLMLISELTCQYLISECGSQSVLVVSAGWFPVVEAGKPRLVDRTGLFTAVITSMMVCSVIFHP